MATVTVTDVVELPALSKALAVSAAVPGVLGVVQLHVYGEVLSEHFELPLTKFLNEQMMLLTHQTRR